MIKDLQALLTTLAELTGREELDPGGVDGILGPRTLSALAAYHTGFDGTEAEPVQPGADGHYHLPKDEDIRLTENFTSREFRCGLGRACTACSETLLDPKLPELLQRIRAHFSAPVTVTSGYRCESYNRSVGGAAGSRHTMGDAADIVVAGVSPRQVAQYAQSIGILGIGLYETAQDGCFVHIDTRPAKSFWYGQAQQSVDSF